MSQDRLPGHWFFQAGVKSFLIEIFSGEIGDGVVSKNIKFLWKISFLGDGTAECTKLLHISLLSLFHWVGLNLQFDLSKSGTTFITIPETKKVVFDLPFQYVSHYQSDKYEHVSFFYEINLLHTMISGNICACNFVKTYLQKVWHPGPLRKKLHKYLPHSFQLLNLLGGLWMVLKNGPNANIVLTIKKVAKLHY